MYKLFTNTEINRSYQAITAAVLYYSFCFFSYFFLIKSEIAFIRSRIS